MRRKRKPSGRRSRRRSSNQPRLSQKRSWVRIVFGGRQHECSTSYLHPPEVRFTEPPVEVQVLSGLARMVPSGIMVVRSIGSALLCLLALGCGESEASQVIDEFCSVCEPASAEECVERETAQLESCAICCGTELEILRCVAEDSDCGPNICGFIHDTCID